MILLASQLVPLLHSAAALAPLSTALSPLLAQVDAEKLATSPWPYALSVALGVIGFQYNENGRLRDRMLEMQAKHYDARIADNKENNALVIALTEAVRANERIAEKLTR